MLTCPTRVSFVSHLCLPCIYSAHLLMPCWWTGSRSLPALCCESCRQLTQLSRCESGLDQLHWHRRLKPTTFLCELWSFWSFWCSGTQFLTVSLCPLCRKSQLESVNCVNWERERWSGTFQAPLELGPMTQDSLVDILTAYVCQLIPMPILHWHLT
jgi:hypothetical protein